MKNVAGYDMSRLAAGSFGCLGVLTEVSLRVLPKPRARRSVVLDLDAAAAMAALSAWRKAALPVTGACHLDGRLHVRLEGGEGSVTSALARIGGEELDLRFWTLLREHRLPFFDAPRPLWRLSLPNAAPLMPWGRAGTLPATQQDRTWTVGSRRCRRPWPGCTRN